MNIRQAQAIDYGIWNVSRYAAPAKPTPIVDAVMLVLGTALTLAPFIALLKGFFQ